MEIILHVFRDEASKAYIYTYIYIYIYIYVYDNEAFRISTSPYNLQTMTPPLIYFYNQCH
jgi:hypothetical protein